MPSYPMLRIIGSTLFVLLVTVGSLRAQETKVPSKSTKAERKVSSVLEELVIVREGELPIIISAPHGGTLAIEGVPPREGKGMETGPRGFFTGRDGGTQELAEAVIDAIHKKFKMRPYAVISGTHRQFLDPNRPSSIAYEDEDAKPVYERYHRSLERFTTEVMNQYRVGLLVDIHGQGTKRDTVFRGTNNGKTVERLRNSFGERAHTGDRSFFALLKKEGWIVYPDPFDGKEQSGFTGGYIVQTYGSHRPIGIDAIQLEMGAEYRTPGSREKTATQLANAIFNYAELYLPNAVKASQ